MLKHTVFLTSLALAAALNLSRAHAQDVDTVIATVNGTDITLGHMIVAHATLPDQYKQLPGDVIYRGILDQLIQQTVLSQSLAEEPAPRVRLAIENETRSLRAGEAIEALLQAGVTDERIEAIYAERYANAEGEEEYNASHILVETEEAAQALVDQLAEGADFAELAREHSTGPSGPSGGSLGWFGSGAMVPSFEAAVIALETGEVSAPVQTRFGWHVIILNETRKLDVPSLDAVRADLEVELQQQMVQETIDGLVGDAKVDRNTDEINPELLKDISLVAK